MSFRVPIPVCGAESPVGGPKQRSLEEVEPGGEVSLSCPEQIYCQFLLQSDACQGAGGEQDPPEEDQGDAEDVRCADKQQLGVP